MTAKEYLLQYKLMTIRIQCAEDDLAALRETRASISINLDGMPRGTATSDKTAELAAQLVDIESEITRMQSEAWRIRVDIVRTVGKLTDPDEVRLLHLRYLEGYTWEKIAVEMDYTYQWVAGPLHGRALRSVEEALNHDGIRT